MRQLSVTHTLDEWPLAFRHGTSDRPPAGLGDKPRPVGFALVRSERTQNDGVLRLRVVRQLCECYLPQFGHLPPVGVPALFPDLVALRARPGRTTCVSSWPSPPPPSPIVSHLPARGDGMARRQAAAPIKKSLGSQALRAGGFGRVDAPPSWTAVCTPPRWGCAWQRGKRCVLSLSSSSRFVAASRVCGAHAPLGVYSPHVFFPLRPTLPPPLDQMHTFFSVVVSAPPSSLPQNSAQPSTTRRYESLTKFKDSSGTTDERHGQAHRRFTICVSSSSLHSFAPPAPFTLSAFRHGADAAPSCVAIFASPFDPNLSSRRALVRPNLSLSPVRAPGRIHPPGINSSPDLFHS
ncbi:hypothetical protein DFH09DRAFT_1336835 [Mycena vulgaris]|nr:hypothetical protein DFH09DRAFT_1336835 [Mycena vulgaris]